MCVDGSSGAAGAVPGMQGGGGRCMYCAPSSWAGGAPWACRPGRAGWASRGGGRMTTSTCCWAGCEYPVEDAGAACPLHAGHGVGPGAAGGAR